MKNCAGDLPDRSEVAKFDQGKLKHVETTEKQVLPDKSSMFLYDIVFKPRVAIHDFLFFYSFCSAIQEEKIDSRAEVKEFPKDKLKHVETVEKNPLPSAGGKNSLKSSFSFAFMHRLCAKK